MSARTTVVRYVVPLTVKTWPPRIASATSVTSVRHRSNDPACAAIIASPHG
jgi:hypothetical protein